MDLYKKIDFLCDQNKVSRRKMCDDIHLSYNTYNSLLKRNSKGMALDTLQDIASYFNVSLDYLISDKITDPNYGKQDIIVIEDEPDKSIIKKFLQLKNNRSKYKIEGAIELCLEEEQSSEKGDTLIG